MVNYLLIEILLLHSSQEVKLEFSLVFDKPLISDGCGTVLQFHYWLSHSQMPSITYFLLRNWMEEVR